MSERKLKSLEDHNREKMNFGYDLFIDNPVPNGIACPECGEEMMDSNPMCMLACIPPKKNIDCPSCGHKDFRIA